MHSFGSGINLLERGLTLFYSRVPQGVRRQAGVGNPTSPQLNSLLLAFSSAAGAKD